VPKGNAKAKDRKNCDDSHRRKGTRCTRRPVEERQRIPEMFDRPNQKVMGIYIGYSTEDTCTKEAMQKRRSTIPKLFLSNEEAEEGNEICAAFWMNPMLCEA